MSFFTKWRAAGAMALGASLVVSSGCAETALVGSLDDSELQDLAVLPLAGLGISREINDLIFANGDYYDYGGFQDDITNAGTAGQERRSTIGDGDAFFDSGTLNGTFAQTQEAIWAGYKVADLGYVLFESEESATSTFETNPVVARAWLAAAQMERFMADLFCEATYQYGPTGGNQVPNLELWAVENGFELFDVAASKVNSKVDMYQRAAFGFERAAETAEGAIAAGDTTGIGEDGGSDLNYNYFDTEIIRDAAYTGLAQVRLNLASLGVDEAANLAAAAAAAANVATNSVDFWNTDGINLRENQNQNLSWDNDDLTHWADTLIVGGETQIWGSAFARHVEPGDLRAARIEDGTGGIQKCYDLKTRVGPDILTLMPEDDTTNIELTHGTNGNDCSRSADRFGTSTIMEYGQIPRWLLDAWSNEDHDIRASDGTDARLIEAEIALRNGDLPLFTQKINEVRTFWGASPISQPATVGELEYPNELDDGWSLLDREFMLDAHGAIGQRLAQLHRWDHPFITENHTNEPIAARFLEEQGAGFQRASCLPLPSNECTLNTEIACDIPN